MDAYLAYYYLMSEITAEKRDLTSMDDEPMESLRRSLQCATCGTGPCAALKYDCGSYCSNVPCANINPYIQQAIAQRNGIIAGVIIGIFLLICIISFFVYKWAKENAKKRTLNGPNSGVMDEGTEMIIIILLGVLAGGLLGICFYMCALFKGREKGAAEARAAVANGGAPAVQGYVVPQGKA